MAVCAGSGDVVEGGPGEGQSGEYQRRLHAGKREKALIVKKTVVDRSVVGGGLECPGWTAGGDVISVDQPISEQRLSTILDHRETFARASDVGTISRILY